MVQNLTNSFVLMHHLVVIDPPSFALFSTHFDVGGFLTTQWWEEGHFIGGENKILVTTPSENSYPFFTQLKIYDFTST